MAAAEVAGKLGTLAYTVAAVRILTEVEFGAFAYALSFSLLAATLPAFGFSALLVQRASAEPGRLRVLLSETLVWRTAIAIPVLVGAGIAGVVLRPDVPSAVALVLLLVASTIDAYSDAGRAAAAVMREQVGVSTALVVQRLGTAILAIAALLGGFGLIGLAASYLAGSVIGAVGVLISVRRLGVRTDLASVHRAGLLRTGRLSVAIGVVSVLSMALFRIDQLMLDALVGDAEVGVYAAAYRLLETVLFLTWAVERAVFPVISASRERWRLRRGVEQGIAVLALVYVPFGVGIWIEAEPILDLLYGPAYAAAGVSALRWLAPAPLIFAVGYMGAYALFARGRRWLVVASVATATAVNVALNLVLIPRMASAGAALTTTVSYGIETLLTMALLVPLMGLVRLDRILAPSAIAAAVMAVPLVLMRQGLATEIALGIAVYTASWLVLARWLAPEHLAVIRSFLRRPGSARDEAGLPSAGGWGSG